METESIVMAAMKEFMIRPGVTETVMFGSPGLKIDGKYFALLVRSRLVVKLTKEKVQSLVETGKGDHFDSGQGRKMKEWIELDPKSKKECMTYMDEAIEVVAAIAAKPKKKAGKSGAKRSAEKA